jgi:PEP-CTERM motif
MKRIPLTSTAIALGVGLLVSAPASANPVAVNNYSFETLPAGGLPLSCGGTCAYSTAPIPGWINSGSDSGQWLIGGFAGNPPAFDGSYIAYSNAESISQDVATAVAGTTYTLQVQLLHRTDEAFDGVVQLEIGGSPVATATGIDGGPGTWSDWTATYTATATDAGQQVTILLSTTGGQGDFDDVRLDASPTVPVSAPEPASLALLGVSLLGLGVSRHKRS